MSYGKFGYIIESNDKMSGQQETFYGKSPVTTHFTLEEWLVNTNLITLKKYPH